MGGSSADDAVDGGSWVLSAGDERDNDAANSVGATFLG